MWDMANCLHWSVPSINIGSKIEDIFNIGQDFERKVFKMTVLRQNTASNNDLLDENKFIQNQDLKWKKYQDMI